MKSFSFTIDDNSWFLKELTAQNAQSLFDHPYTQMLRRLHEKFGIRFQLNMFYRYNGFCLTEASDRYAAEWEACSDWLKMSFHSREAIARIYEASDYKEVYLDCQNVNREILRFACPASLAKTTTIHYCAANDEGVQALSDNGIKGLLGLFGSDARPRVSYNVEESIAKRLRRGEMITDRSVTFGAIDMVLNCVEKDEIAPLLSPLLDRETIRLMIHEQYFYADFERYQADFEEKLSLAFEILCKHGYRSQFFEDMI